MRPLLKRLRDNLVNSLLLSLFISVFVNFYTVNDFIEKESVKFQSIKNSFIGNKSKLILLGMLTEETISSSNTQKEQSGISIKGSSAIYQYGATNSELSAQEAIIYDTMNHMVNLDPQSIESNITILYRSFKTRKLFSTRSFDDLVVKEDAFSLERCEVTGTCTLNATKNQLIDRVIVSPIYRDLLSNRATLSITTPVYYSGEIIGEYLVDIYVDGKEILEGKEISTREKGIYNATVIEERDYPFSDFSYVLEFVTDNRSLLIYKIPFTKLVVDTLWINGIIFCFVFTLLWKVSELGIKREKLKNAERVATRDELTGLYNRAIFRDESFKQLTDKYSLSILAIDGNRIKKINDTYGHAVGDEAIKHISSCMKRIFRESDYLIRTGGDEFLALLPNCNVDMAYILAEKLNNSVASSQVAFRHINISISIGVVEQHIGESLEAAISRADSELYKEKNNYEENDVPMEKSTQLS